MGESGQGRKMMVNETVMGSGFCWFAEMERVVGVNIELLETKQLLVWLKADGTSVHASSPAS